MINQKEAERAHDTLVKLLESPKTIDQIALQYIGAALDVLCWLLEHEHNPNFQDNLDRIDLALRIAAEDDREEFAAVPTAGGIVQ